MAQAKKQKSSSTASRSASRSTSSTRRRAGSGSGTSTSKGTGKGTGKSASTSTSATKNKSKSTSATTNKGTGTGGAAPIALDPAAVPSDDPRGFPIAPGWTGDVHEFDASATPGFAGDKKKGRKLLARSDAELSDLQERLFAAHHGAGQGGRGVLLVVQGMDTSGKGGIMRHVVGAVDPQGVDITAFKSPTDEEKEHDFLWRIRPHAPAPGMIGVFDRSHYEDVLIHRVHGWADEDEIQRRYRAINAFEQELVEAGTTVVKVMLHVSYVEQGGRLAERLERPDKHWKFNPADIDERGRWSAYMDAYSRALEATSTEHAPWVVVPADRKWYARIAVQRLLLQALRTIDPQWPAADFDVDEQMRRLRASRVAAD